jgi:predicted nucleic acid-binding protein
MRFADTSFWLALLRKDDSQHVRAEQLARANHVALVTSNHVIGETWSFLCRRDGHRAALAFLSLLDEYPRLEVEHASERIEADAWVWLRRHDERPYSFVDATSFAVMRKRRIAEALTFDSDFTAAGFNQVRE